MKVKLCGFTEEKSLLSAIENNADFIGFVFYHKSPRNIQLQQAKILGNLIPKHIKKVAVTVNADLDYLYKIIAELNPDFLQLHGQENIHYIANIKNHFPAIGIIKAITISKEEDLQQVVDFVDAVDMILFDNKLEKEIGGTGKSFDFKILQNFSCKKDWFLSGGLNINNITEALRITGAKFCDLSSGIEIKKGEKSPDLIKEFMTKIKNVD